MIMRDKIQELILIETEDGFGGVVEQLTPSSFLSCKLSVSNDTAKATAYGVLTGQVLEVITASKLNTANLYAYQEKKYSVRKALQKGRYFYFTLVEEV